MAGREAIEKLKRELRKLRKECEEGRLQPGEYYISTGSDIEAIFECKPRSTSSSVQVEVERSRRRSTFTDECRREDSSDSNSLDQYLFL